MDRAVDGGGLPTFLIVGAAKAGTTSLYHYLRQHPEIYMSPVKEPRYFAVAERPTPLEGPGDERLLATMTTTLEAYRRLFAGVREEKAAGEASVIYLPHPDAPAAISRHVPDVRLIAVLRNPVRRAYSAYLHNVRDGYEPLDDFAAALAAEAGRIAAGWDYRWRYRGNGFYHRFLSRYLEHFERARLRVYLHEDLDRDPQGVLADMFAFLEVDPGFRPDVSARHNRSGVPRNARLQRLLSKHHPVKDVAKRVVPEHLGHRLISRLQPANLTRPALPSETSADLTAGYAEDIRRLEELIGRDLSGWLEPSS